MKNLIFYSALLVGMFLSQVSNAQDDCSARADYDWDVFTGTPTGNTYSDESVDFTFSVAGDGGITGNDTGNNFPTGFFFFPTSWEITQNDNNINTFTIDFNGDLLYDFCFAITDVDDAGSADIVTVNAYDATNTLITLVAGDLSNQGDRIQYNGNNEFEGTGTSPTFFGGAPRSNVTICFPSPIQRIEIVFDSNDGADAQDFGVTDFNYCSQDFDNDGIKDDAETDSDGDGILNSVEGYVPGDADGDGIPNVYDADFPGRVDANGDNTDDNFDSDLDGAPDALDLDSDNDGILDATENLPTSGGLPANTDGTGDPDYLDSDSDDDGISDLIEGNDIDFNGITDVTLAGTDADGDGIDDNIDTVNDLESTGNSTGSAAAVAANLVDNDDIEDYRDTDDDGDGILTSAEIPDANGDGIPDYISACEDGSVLNFDGFADGTTPGPVFNVDAVDITFSFTDPSNVSQEYEIDDQIQTDNYVRVLQTATSASAFTLLRVIFDKPLEGFCFDLLDIDRGPNNHLDSMSVNIFRDGDVIVLDGTNIITGAFNRLNTNNFIVGTDESDDDEYLGNVRLCLLQSVDSLVIRYGNAIPIGNQAIGLDDFSWCGIDSDYDEILDFDDPDDNNNGIADIIEGGGVDHSLDSDGDKIPDYLDADFPGFTDTNADGVNDNADLDLDGIPDQVDKDTDNDGIPDAVEANGGILPANMDDDGAYSPAYALANDSDNDGRVDDIDDTDGFVGGTPLTNPNTDGDAVNDIRDLDSDGDGIPDLVEAGGTDSNNDGVIDNFSDNTNDGFHDGFDPDVFGTTLLSGSITRFARDSDTDGLSDYLDIDSDNDGILDNVEGQSSTGFIAEAGADGDGDGWDNSYDSDNGGTAPPVTDTDTDATPDYLDTDSDGDGVSDSIESRDTNSDGVADELFVDVDTDSDGLDDAYDTDCAPCGAVVGASAATQDLDLDAQPDYRDTDDDGDGLLTSSEDFNANADFTDDFTQGGSSPDYLFFTNDTDGDGIDNDSDPDDNNDGILDSEVTSTCNITYEWTGTIDGDRDRTLPDDLNKDFVFGDNYGFRLTFDNSTQVVIQTTIGDQSNARTGTVTVDGVAENINVTAGNFQTVTHTPIAASVYDIDIVGTDMSVTTIVVNDTYGNEIAQFDFGTAASTVEPGYIGVNSATTQTATTYSCFADSDGDGISDQFDLDIDGDGIPNAYEANDGTLPANMDENGQYSSTYALANDSDSDGIVDDIDDTGGAFTGGTPLSKNDFDSDGLADFRDVDTDGDGIPDSIESTGTDTNANGIPDTFTDTDSDGNLDYRDADSDNDGIPDLREGQTSAAFIGSPSGTDTDGDGLSDSFDADNGGTAIVGNDHDGDGTPDFQDSDSDNDGIVDLIDGNDNNIDGSADTALASADTDGDGLDNAFDTDNGGTAPSLQNTDADSEPDWRDNDDDGDGTPTNDENVDIDPANGTPDYLESNGNTCGVGFTSAAANAIGVESEDGIGNGGGAAALGAANYVPGSGDFNTVGAIGNGGELDIYLGAFVPSGSTITIDYTAIAVGDQLNISSSPDNVTYGNLLTFVSTVTTAGAATFSYVTTEDVSFVKFTVTVGGDIFGIDALSFTGCFADSDNDGVQDDADNDSDNDGLDDLTEGNGTDPTADADADGLANYLDPDFAGYVDLNSDGINDNFDKDLDGVPNHQDLDSDNDGVPDAVEANEGVLPANMTSEGAYLSSYVRANDGDLDGHADDVDTDSGGTAFTNPDTDNGTGYDDGLPDFLDSDSDNDGITDAAENDGVDLNRDGQIDSFVDTDGDGLHDSYDPDNGGTALSIVNTDGDADPDYLDTDSDNDSAGTPGLGDLFEGHDSNFDGTPSWDDDGDLVLDTDEGNIDLDGDGIVDAFDPDQGGIGAALPNADGDGLANFRDNDDDDDGILTIAEDADGDGNYFNDFTEGQADEFANVPDYLFNDVSPLPVELLSFKVTLVDNKAELVWITAQEINNEKFEIEYSNDGLTFDQVGVVAGSGNSNAPIEYSFVHNDLRSGFNYYRLKQVDFNGDFEYSEIKRISLGAFEGITVSVFPNPTSDVATIQLQQGVATKIELITLHGIVVQTVSYEGGTSSHRFDTSDLDSGIYLIRVTGPDVNTIERLVVK
ncbi:T9SS type A sorting domain-containing protein [Ekhidna sp.]